MEGLHWRPSRGGAGASGRKTSRGILRCRSRRSHGDNAFTTRGGILSNSSSSRSHYYCGSRPSSSLLRFIAVQSWQSFGRTRSRNGRWYFLSLMALISCLVRPAVPLVVEPPLQATFEHVPAAFGPDALLVDPPLESRPLVKARPKDGCSPFWSVIEDGGIALVERGRCNFTEKVLHAQEAGASAVVVTDTRLTENWWTVMYGDPTQTQGIVIPAVMVSQEAGKYLWFKRFWLASGTMRVSINATGHILLRTPPVGTLESLGIYILLVVMLLTFSGIFGLIFAMAYTWYQRGARARGMRRLKSFVYHQQKPVLVGTSSSGGDDDHRALRSSGGTVDDAGRDSTSASGRGGSREDNNGMRADDDTCAICLESYEEGDSLTRLPCKHSFHSHCIRQWLSGASGLCPMCKRETFSRGVLPWVSVPQIEAIMAELAELCTDNLTVMVLFFLSSVACGYVAARLSSDG